MGVIRNNRVIKKTSRGMLAKEDRVYIEKNLHTKSDEEIAKKINRAVAQVTKYRAKLITGRDDLVGEFAEIEEIRHELRAEPEWETHRKSMTPEEISIFERSWISIMLQFKRDMHATDKKQLFQALTIETKINRHNAMTYNAMRDMERMRKILDEECARDKEERDSNLIETLSSTISATQQASMHHTKEFDSLSNRFSNIMKDLKGTRDRRLETAQEESTNLVSILVKLEQEETRRIFAIEDIAVKEAIKKERKRLTSYETYLDGEVDQPILSAHTYIPPAKEKT